MGLSFDEVDVDVESPIFDPALTETREDQPFEIYGVGTAGRDVRRDHDSEPVPRCLAVSGIADGVGERLLLPPPRHHTLHLPFSINASTRSPRAHSQPPRYRLLHDV